MATVANGGVSIEEDDNVIRVQEVNPTYTMVKEVEVRPRVLYADPEVRAVSPIRTTVRAVSPPLLTKRYASPPLLPRLNERVVYSRSPCLTYAPTEVIEVRPEPAVYSSPRLKRVSEEVVQGGPDLTWSVEHDPSPRRIRVTDTVVESGVKARGTWYGHDLVHTVHCEPHHTVKVAATQRSAFTSSYHLRAESLARRPKSPMLVVAEEDEWRRSRVIADHSYGSVFADHSYGSVIADHSYASVFADHSTESVVRVGRNAQREPAAKSLLPWPRSASPQPATSAVLDADAGAWMDVNADAGAGVDAGADAGAGMDADEGSVADLPAMVDVDIDEDTLQQVVQTVELTEQQAADLTKELNDLRYGLQSQQQLQQAVQQGLDSDRKSKLQQDAEDRQQWHDTRLQTTVEHHTVIREILTTRTDDTCSPFPPLTPDSHRQEEEQRVEALRDHNHHAEEERRRQRLEEQRKAEQERLHVLQVELELERARAEAQKRALEDEERQFVTLEAVVLAKLKELEDLHHPRYPELPVTQDTSAEDGSSKKKKKKKLKKKKKGRKGKKAKKAKKAKKGKRRAVKAEEKLQTQPKTKKKKGTKWRKYGALSVGVRTPYGIVKRAPSNTRAFVASIHSAQAHDVTVPWQEKILPHHGSFVKGNSTANELRILEQFLDESHGSAASKGSGSNPIGSPPPASPLAGVSSSFRGTLSCSPPGSFQRSGSGSQNQSFSRRPSTLKKLDSRKSFSRGRSFKSQIEEENAAAVAIQDAFRTYKDKEVWKEIQNDAALKIQNSFRSFKKVSSFKEGDSKLQGFKSSHGLKAHGSKSSMGSGSHKGSDTFGGIPTVVEL